MDMSFKAKAMTVGTSTGWPGELPTTILALRLSDYLLLLVIAAQHGQGQPPALPTLVPPALQQVFPEPAAPTFHSPQAASLS